MIFYLRTISPLFANGTTCGKERPDFVIHCGSHVILLEVDEGQHKHYECLCKQVRMINITQAFGGLPCFWIRYNPDAFKNDKGMKSKITGRKREVHLLKWIKLAQTRIPRR